MTHRNPFTQLRTLFLVLATLTAFGRPAMAQFGLAGADRVGVELVWQEAPTPGATTHLGVVLNIETTWHVQAGKGSGDEVAPYIPTTIDLTLPAGWTAGAIKWPKAHVFELRFGDIVENLSGYEGRLLAAIPVTVPAGATAGDYTIQANVGYQACDAHVCDMPTSTSVSAKVTVGGAVPPPDAAIQKLFADVIGKASAAPTKGAPTPAAPSAAGGPAASAGFIGLLLLAFVGGFLLNLTPCVLPVIPLKIMGLAQSGKNRGRTLALGIAMALGVVAFWMALGLAIATISGFTSANQLFQYPWFAIGVGIVIAILAVGMCGLFSVRLPSFVYAINPSHDSYHGSFLFGILTAVLSTPCTAPFMGGAAAAAVGQSTWLVLSVFGAIGAGMALPYLVLAAFPQLARRMPRTGPASELIKQVMGLFMLSAAVLFIGIGVSALVATGQTAPSRAYFWATFAPVVAGCAWMMYRTVRITPSIYRRAFFVALGAIGIAASIFGATRLSRSDAEGPIAWVYYEPARFQESLADGKIVVVEFTAEWCLNCKLLEKTVLNSRVLAERLGEKDVVPMKVDLTSRNEAGAELLAKTGSRTIPWLVVFRSDGSAVWARNWYTPDDVLGAIEQAGGSQVAARSGTN